jgi:nucleotidyltransferase/DNA polymerase involved in DNA repair
MIISLFMGPPVCSHWDRAADAPVEQACRERGKQPDGRRQPQVVGHGRKKGQLSALSYQLSAFGFSCRFQLTAES